MVIADGKEMDRYGVSKIHTRDRRVFASGSTIEGDFIGGTNE